MWMDGLVSRSNVHNLPVDALTVDMITNLKAFIIMGR